LSNFFGNPEHPTYPEDPVRKNCRYCKKPGHVIDECRKLKWKKEQEKKETSKSDQKPSTSGKRPNSPAFSKINVVQTQEKSKEASAHISTIGIKSDMSDMIIQLESPAIRGQPLLFLVDTGAETSLVRKERLENSDNLLINSENTKLLTGFGDNKTHSTIGNVKIPLLFDSELYHMTFNVIEGIKLNLDIDGILGRNIMVQGGATINCSTNRLEFT